jgi:hypothetical protein
MGWKFVLSSSMIPEITFEDPLASRDGITTPISAKY